MNVENLPLGRSNYSEFKNSKLGKILSQDKDNRTQADLEYIYKELKHLDFFKSLNEKDENLIMTHLLKCMEFKEYKANEVIFKYGEMGTHCYIILKGTVDLLLPPPKTSKNIRIFIQASNKNCDSVNSMDDMQQMDPFEQNEQNDVAISKVLRIYMTPCSSFLEGSMFGERELQTRMKRVHMARCQTNCLLGVISKFDYANIFENTKRLEYNDELKFFYSLNVLKGCPNAIVEKLMTLFEKKHYKQGDVIVRQGSIFDKVFLVRKGNFQVSYSGEKKFTSEFDLNFFIKLNKKDERFTADRMYELKGTYKNKENYKLLILGHGEFFGDVELSNESDKFICSLTCLMDKSEMYECGKNKFLTNLSGHFIQKIIDLAREHQSFYKQRFSEIKGNKKTDNKFHKVVLEKTNDDLSVSKGKSEDFSLGKKGLKINYANIFNKKSNYEKTVTKGFTHRNYISSNLSEKVIQTETNEQGSDNKKSLNINTDPMSYTQSVCLTTKNTNDGKIYEKFKFDQYLHDKMRDTERLNSEYSSANSNLITQVTQRTRRKQELCNKQEGIASPSKKSNTIGCFKYKFSTKTLKTVGSISNSSTPNSSSISRHKGKAMKFKSVSNFST